MDVPEAVWNFHVGGYQVCHKWLKDRKGRTLSQDDIEHYQKIVVALGQSIEFMKQIDAATNLIGNAPTSFELITTAGLIFWISVPIVGSKFTSQTFPLCGVNELVIDNISSH